MVVECPKCGGQITLASDEPFTKPRGRLLAAVVAAVFVIMVVPVAWALFRHKAQRSVPQTVTNGAARIETIPKSSNPPAPIEIETNQFRIGQITLEKGEGTGITYALGTLKNSSEHQRFGVKIILDVLDADDHRIGSASDYLAVLDPAKEWRFRALVTEPGAAGVKVAGITERK